MISAICAFVVGALIIWFFLGLPIINDEEEKNDEQVNQTETVGGERDNAEEIPERNVVNESPPPHSLRSTTDSKTKSFHTSEVETRFSDENYDHDQSSKSDAAISATSVSSLSQDPNSSSVETAVDVSEIRI